MKRKTILTALSISAAAAVLTLSLGNPALADDGGDGHYRSDAGQRDHGRDNWRKQQRAYRRGGEEDQRGYYRNRNGDEYHREHRDYGERSSNWYRGERLRDGDFRALTNWRAYHLPRPDADERYVIVNNDRVLRVNRNTMTVMAEVGLLNALLNN